MHWTDFFRNIIILIAVGLSSAVHAAPEPILIGVLSPMTGSTAKYGKELQEGALTAIEKLNTAGGLDGRLYEPVLINDGCDPEKSLQAVHQAINRGIKFVVAHICSDATLAVTKAYEKEGIIAITPGATLPAVTEASRGHYFFRTIGRDDIQGSYIASVIIAHLKAKKIVLLHDNETYGVNMAQYVKGSLEKFGASIALYEGIESGAKDYSAVITKLKSINPDTVFFGGYTPEMGLLLRQARDQGLKTRFIGPEGVYSPNLIDIAGAAVEGMVFTSPADFSARPENQSIAQAFQKAHRAANGNYQMPAYAALQVLHESMKVVGPDPKKVADYMHTNRFSTVIGSVAFDRKGDLKNFDFAVFELDKNGERKRVH